MHLRLIVPAPSAAEAVSLLRADPRTTNLVHLAGAGVEPAGDLVMCEVAREGASDVLGRLRHLQLAERGGITLSELDAAPSRGALDAERAAPGAPDDGVVWDIVEERAVAEARPSWAFYAFLALATSIAAVAIVLDSAVLVVGACVVSPEFGAVSAIAVGLTLRQPRLAGRAARLLLYGFVAAVAVTALAALAARGAGWVDGVHLTSARPITGYIYRPDRWSFVVAILAGTAGVLSQTAGRGNALIGVFISVTTVPAAGNLALALALGASSEIGGSAAQLVVNVAGMTLAGVLTLLVQRLIWRQVHRQPPVLDERSA